MASDTDPPKVPGLPPPRVEQMPPRAERIVYPENPRYRRLRFVSVLMDQSIALPNGYRIGLDPVMGLLPGIGDVLGAGISCYVVYEAARLGLPKRVLARMVSNVVIEALAGCFPILGDIFDVVWKANTRNLRLVDLHYHPAMPERPAGRIAAWLLAVLGLLTAGNLALAYLVLRALFSVMGLTPSL